MQARGNPSASIAGGSRLNLHTLRGAAILAATMVRKTQPTCEGTQDGFLFHVSHAFERRRRFQKERSR